jgi:hypothetical protein
MCTRNRLTSLRTSLILPVCNRLTVYKLFSNRLVGCLNKTKTETVFPFKTFKNGNGWSLTLAENRQNCHLAASRKFGLKRSGVDERRNIRLTSQKQQFVV